MPTPNAPGSAKGKSLDRLLAEHEHGRIDLLKVDTDGHDLRVLRGAAAFLAAQSILFVEFHPELLRAGGDEPVALWPLRASCGYTNARLSANRGHVMGSVSLDRVDAPEIERMIEGDVVEYLDVLAWGPRHAPLMTRLAHLESGSARARRT